MTSPTPAEKRTDVGRVGLGWLVFVQVPQADTQAQLLRQSAIKEAQFGQLDAGRFRSFSCAAMT